MDNCTSSYRAFFAQYVKNLTPNEQAYGECPFHRDTNRSFSVDLREGLWTCHKCGIHGNAVQFAQRANIPLSGVPGIRASENPKTRRELVFDYCDEKGEVLYQEVRREGRQGKKIVFRRPDGRGSFVNDLGDGRRVLYRLPELIEAAERDAPILIPEGPAKVDALRNLGHSATCNPFGAKHWNTDYSRFLQGFDVVLIPDNDKEGWGHIDQIGRALIGIAASIRVLELPNLPEKGDIIDWLRFGGTAEELSRLIRCATIWQSGRGPTPQKGDSPRTSGYFMVPNWPFTLGNWKRLTPNALAVYPALARRADNRTKQCRPTLRDLEAETGVFWKSISAATDRLQRERLIRKTRKGNRVVYTVLFDPSDLASEVASDMQKNSAYAQADSAGGPDHAGDGYAEKHGITMPDFPASAQSMDWRMESGVRNQIVREPANEIPPDQFESASVPAPSEGASSMLDANRCDAALDLELSSETESEGYER